MHRISYRIAELLLIFVLIPVSFLLSYPIGIKVGIGIVGFIYILYLLKKEGLLSPKFNLPSSWNVFLKETILKLISIAVITTIYVYFVDQKALFNVLINKPGLWIIILCVYSLFSVWPQELLYRTFFFQRYRVLVRNEKLFIVLNALLFSLAHTFLNNPLVFVLTFIGGLLFAYTYTKTNSTLLVSIEHALYGNWLFTVGMGEMLAFPS